MKKSRFTESRIFSILKEGETGIKTADICRRRGIAESTYHNWKARYGGASVPIIKRMKELSHDLSQYKRMCAENAFECEAPRHAAINPPLSTARKITTWPQCQASRWTLSECADHNIAQLFGLYMSLHKCVIIISGRAVSTVYAEKKDYGNH